MPGLETPKNNQQGILGDHLSGPARICTAQTGNGKITVRLLKYLNWLL